MLFYTGFFKLAGDGSGTLRILFTSFIQKKDGGCQGRLTTDRLDGINMVTL